MSIALRRDLTNSFHALIPKFQV